MSEQPLMMTIVETAAFDNAKKGLLSQEDEWDVIGLLSENPEIGAVMRGTGGVRKVRFGTNNRGKSGSVRIVYYFHSEQLPVFLLTVFAKNDRENLTQAERNQLKKLVDHLVATYRKKNG